MNSTSPLEGHREVIEGLLAQQLSYRQIAQALADLYDFVTSEASIRRAVRRWGIRGNRKPHSTPSGKTQYGSQFENPGFSVNADDAEITSDPRAWKSYLNDTNALLTERGLDPEDWDIQSLTVNEWDSPTGETLKQLKVHLKRKKPTDMVSPARVALGRVFTIMRPGHVDVDSELVVLVGDHHAPFHNTDLHARFCEFLNDQQPERGILMGDLIDLPDISRHPTEPDWKASTQKCLDTGSQIILDYKEASEVTQWAKLPGNHMERLRRAIIDRLGDFYSLRPAQVSGLEDLPSIHDPAYLLRLDEMGVAYIGARGGYRHARYMVTPSLAATHGDSAKKGSGTTALAKLATLDHSIVIGHTHRQSLVQRAVSQIDGTSRLLQAGETGCMCLIEEGLGYAPTPDWSNGFITAAVWPDGTFKLDLATYVDRKLFWRSERY